MFFSTYEQVEELADGYALRYTWTTDWATQLLTFIALLRAAAPTISIDLICEPQQGPIWLRLYGSAVIKAMIQHALAQFSQRRVNP